MTEAKKLKQTIRTRARKTGESYTAARRQVLAARAILTPKPIAATPSGNASVVADNTKLGSASEVAERRALWRVALASLKAHFVR